MNNLYKLILKRRTIRSFKKKKVSINTIKKIINAARLAPSAANLQFIEYLIVDKKHLKDELFVCTKWGGYVYPKRVPSIEERPYFYIVILINKNKSKNPDLRDVGAAAQNILLSSMCFNLGCCWIASLNRSRIRELLGIPKNYIIDSVIACGFPNETPLLEERKDTIKYWLDNKNRLHVPKRPFKEIFHYNRLESRK